MIKHLHELINYGLTRNLIQDTDKKYIYNQLLYFFKLDHVSYDVDVKDIDSPEEAIFPSLDDLYNQAY